MYSARQGTWDKNGLAGQDAHINSTGGMNSGLKIKHAQ